VIKTATLVAMLSFVASPVALAQDEPNTGVEILNKSFSSPWPLRASLLAEQCQGGDPHETEEQWKLDGRCEGFISGVLASEPRFKRGSLRRCNNRTLAFRIQDEILFSAKRGVRLDPDLEARDWIYRIANSLCNQGRR
jgi:hypothetical protein